MIAIPSMGKAELAEDGTSGAISPPVYRFY
jgi:hypothetical protein